MNSAKKNFMVGCILIVSVVVSMICGITVGAVACKNPALMRLLQIVFMRLTQLTMLTSVLVYCITFCLFLREVVLDYRGWLEKF